ncbi:MAG TPA: zinc ABC transporter substrate-binding protein [Thioalkalivibrio sp.]|nr:zinc ABC transporter substrate-binding protein [Thioalkalivibrio sp.]
MPHARFLPRRPLLLGLLALLGLLLALPARAEPPRVVATLKPLHALAAAVTDGVSEPHRLLPDGSSPHAYSLRPSDMRALHGSDILLWVGPEMETFLQAPIRSLPDSTHEIRALTLPGMTLHRLHGSHDHGHDDHAHGDHAIDAHLWLDPDNAQVIVAALAQRLRTLDPANAERYAANAERLRQRLESVDRELASRLAGLRGNYVVFHDAYQYFEHRYGLQHAAALTIDPGRTPGARRVREIRAIIRQTNARCVFAEPQFRPALVDTLIQDTDARAAELDPLGTAIPDGPDAYPQLLLNLAAAFEDCLL